MSLREDAESEVEAFHEYIETWFAGQSESTDDAFERVAVVLPDDFEIISPTGERRDGPEIRAALRNSHGAFADSEPTFEARVANVQTRVERDEHCVVTYEEWRRTDGDWEGRVSSALFRRAETAPNGVEWVHLHETWLPDDADHPDSDPQA